MEKYGVENVKKIQEEELLAVKAKIWEISKGATPTLTKEASAEFSRLCERAKELENSLRDHQ